MECQVGDAVIHYETRGRGRPLIVLHGRPADHTYLMASLEPILFEHDGWKRIYPDLPGAGGTKTEESVRGNDEVLDIMVDFIKAAIPAQHFTVIGHSYGAYIARGIVARIPTMVDGLFLWAPTVIKPRAEMKLPPHIVLVNDPAAASELTGDGLEREMFKEVLVVQSQKGLDYIRTHLAPSMEAASQMTRDVYEAPFTFPMETKSFDKPTLILCGRQDSVVGYEDAMRILESYPRATFSVLDRAGHLIGLVEQEDVFGEMIGEWLARVEEGMGLQVSKDSG